MATYSLAITGYLADGGQNDPKNLTIQDDYARLGDMQNAMMTGQQVLCKGPDGAIRLYTFDAERSTPDKPILKPVGP